MERKRYEDEEKELEDFEKRQQEVREKELLERLENDKKGVVKKAVQTVATQQKKSQLKLLAGAVKRKSDKIEDSPKKVKSSDDQNCNNKAADSAISDKKPAPALLGLAAYGSDSDDSDS